MTKNKPFECRLTDQDGTSVQTLFTEIELAKRWRISIKKLQADRLKGDGSTFIKIGRLVRYHIEDIVAYEDACRHTSTSGLG